MKNAIKNIQINHFIFEQGDASVLMDCNIKKGKNNNEHTTFHISQTDLNAIITKLTMLGVNAMEYCQTYTLENGSQLFEINLNKLEAKNRSLMNLSFYNPAIKIQA